MRNKKVVFITEAALIAAVYVVLTVLGAAYSLGEIQVRISEMLTVLPAFTPAAVPGIFLGCLLGNTFAGAHLADVIIGSVTSFVAAFITYKIGEKKIYLATLPPIILNAAVVPFVLRYAYGVPLPIPFMVLTVGIGQVLSCGILGGLLGSLLKKNKKVIFR